MSNDNDLMPSLLDLEIDSDARDAFGHRHFAKALQSLVESQRHHPPYSVGLLGKWGTGKSSIKSLYLASLNDDISRREKFKPITFNAWRFGDDNLKRALLRHVYLSLGGTVDGISEALFQSVQHTGLQPRPAQDMLSELYEKYPWRLLQLLVVFVLTGIVLLLIPAEYQHYVTSAIGAFLVAGLLARAFWLNLDKFLIARYSPVSRTTPPNTTGEQFETLLMDRVKDWKKSKEGKKCERLIIFVDDLDRLSAEEMVKGLDAVRTFMEIPKSDLAGLGIVFIISCDEERVAEALSKGRSRSNDLPGSVFNRSDARRFLDRIFQFRLEIPLFPRQDLRGFALKRFRDDLPELVEELKSKNIPIENVVERLIHVDVQDPRNVLQNLNAFSQCWWVAKQRERDGAGTNRQGALGEGAVSSHPISLAALCALRVDYPDFYHDLQHTPDLLKRFDEVFTRDMTPEDRETRLNEQPEAIRLLLASYWDSDKKQIRPENRRLRQYIASLRGLRWPPSLQPLLLLSQDPATRKMGDRAPRLVEAFVSGDTQGVLAEFGRDNDAKPLSSDDVRLLRDLAGDLVNEVDTRRDNGAAVIAELSSRLRPEDAPTLLSPLARRLIESPVLRHRVGVPHIHSVLEKTYDDDRRGVAASLIDDLLREDSDINFQTSDFETPTLDQALDMVSEVMDIALEVRATSGLDSIHDTKLLTWLESRRVATGGKVDSLSFERFEQWIAKYESPLLQAYAHRYAELVIQQLEADDVNGWDVTDALRRTRLVLENLATSGEESRGILWKLLARLVSVKNGDSVALAWDLTTQHRSDLPKAIFNTFTQNFAVRALKNMTVDGWEYDWKNASEALIQLAESRTSDLEEATASPLTDLGKSWGEDNSTADFSVRLMKLLQKIDDTDLDEVWQDWAGRLLTNLPEPCLRYFASQFGPQDSDTVQTAVITSLSTVASTTAITDEVASKFRQFMGHLSKDGIRTGQMQSYLRTLFAFVQEQYENPQGYLTKIFEVIPPIIEQSPNGPTGAMLHNLFSNAGGSPQSNFGWLCLKMAEHWPEDDADLRPYTPQRIFNLCQSQLVTWAPKPFGYGLVNSMKYMVQNGLVTESHRATVVESACLLWPYHREEALEALQTLEEIPTPTDIAKLAEGTDLENDGEVEDLLTAWKHFIENTPDTKILDVGQELLQLQVGIPSEPDKALRLWFDAQAGQKTSVLRSLMKITGLNDVQKQRIWLQVIPTLDEMTESNIIELVGEVLAFDSYTATQRALLDSQSEINSRFQSKDSRYPLAEQLLRSFHQTGSQEVKNRLAAWMKELTHGDDGFLKETKNIGQFSPEDVFLLSEHFPKSKTLKKLQNNT